MSSWFQTKLIRTYCVWCVEVVGHELPCIRCPIALWVWINWEPCERIRYPLVKLKGGRSSSLLNYAPFLLLLKMDNFFSISLSNCSYQIGIVPTKKRSKFSCFINLLWPNPWNAWVFFNDFNLGSFFTAIMRLTDVCNFQNVECFLAKWPCFLNYLPYLIWWLLATVQIDFT